MPTLQQLSEQANAFTGSRQNDMQIVSSLLNQYVWSDTKLHDCVDIGWEASRIPGVHYVRVEALDGWQYRAWGKIVLQLCNIMQMYAGATDNSACQPFYDPSETGVTGPDI